MIRRKWLAVLIALAGPAFAAPTFHVEPTASAYELRLDGQVGQFAPGLGLQARVAPNNTWSLGLMGFGSALGVGTNAPGYALSLAPFASLDQVGITAGAGLDFAKVQGGVSGLLQGFTWRQNTFFVLGLNQKFFTFCALHVFAGR